MSKWSVRQYRGWNDFMFGSFTVYVLEDEIIIRGVLKKSRTISPYMMIRTER